MKQDNGAATPNSQAADNNANGSADKKQISFGPIPTINIENLQKAQSFKIDAKPTTPLGAQAQAPSNEAKTGTAFDKLQRAMTIMPQKKESPIRQGIP